jgi:hypothetical protein
VVGVGAVLGVVTAGELPVVVGATVVLGLGGAGTLSLGIVVPGSNAVTDARAGPPVSAGAKPVGAPAGADLVLVVEPIANAAANGMTTAAAKAIHRQRVADVPEPTPISLPAATPASIASHPPVGFARQS